ncbi:hypothetical protein CHUAL_011172 [Chamberlinius hualienensis]
MRQNTKGFAIGPKWINNSASIILCLLIVTNCIQTSLQISKEDFYAFGSSDDGQDGGYEQLPNEIDDTSSIEISLKNPIVYFGNVYKSVFVNANGLLSFVTEIPSFYNIQFPLDYPVIAVLYSDVDTRGHGTVRYGEVDDTQSLNDMTQGIRMHFSFAQNFQAKSAFIVTWDEVGYYNSKGDKLNTFQLVLVTDGQSSFAYLLYAANSIQWIQSEGKTSGLPDAKAQAGFMSGDGRMFALHGSGTDHVRNLDKLSNIGNPGVWLFHLGKLFPGQNIGIPDTNVGTDFSDFQTCLKGSALCHTDARCVDYSGGYCCECTSGFYGNGHSCLKDGVPQRINGVVTGMLNGVEIVEADLHSYVVTSEGRQYTAVSRVPEMIGFDMQLLISFGGVVGWLFASPQGKAKNGFQLTGGIFNCTTEIQFPQTGHSVSIKQVFTGVDAFNYLRVKSEIKGTVPVVPGGAQLAVNDFTEEFSEIESGLIRSQAKHVFKFEGQATQETPFKLTMLISFDDCEHSPKDSELHTLRIQHSRTFYMYDRSEQIVRYGSSNKITTLGGDDPCREGRKKCGPNSSCMVEATSYRCVCNPGYQYYHDGVNDAKSSCVDINECTSGQHNCHRYATCVNDLGSFRCSCESGYSGDGVNCERSQSCDELGCSENADCVSYGPQRQLECRCKEGYHGDGYDCSPIGQEQDCLVYNYCDPNAECVQDATTGSEKHVCRCLKGFRGDGVVCVEDDDEGAVSCNVLNTCHPHATCAYDVQEGTYNCVCNPEYEGDGYTCERKDVSCDQANICSVNAYCAAPSDANEKATCVCNSGYDGDGIDCNPSNECASAEDCGSNAHCSYDQHLLRFKCSCDDGFVTDPNNRGCVIDVPKEATCEVANNCHRYAQCSYKPGLGKYTCHCNSGYTGDGLNCELDTSCDVLNNCDVNAECLPEHNSTTQEDRRYQCQCNDGFVGDGINCVAGRSCNDQYDCDPNADCVPLSNTQYYVCQCLTGYVGNGASCAEAPKFEGNFLLASQGMTIVRLPLQAARGDHGKPVIMQPNQMVIGIDVDCGAGHVYWTDVAGRSIKKANYDGSNAGVFIDNDVESPEGLAVDWVSRNLYWTDSLKDTIEVARLDVPSRDRKVIIDKGLVNPRGIAVYPTRGMLFWSDWNREGPKLESASMDGSGRTTLISTNIELPNSLSVDYEREEICWADAGTKRIECCSVFGQNRRTIVSAINYPFGLTNNREYFYWTDWESRKIEVVSKLGGQLQAPLEPPLGGGGRLYGVVAVPDRCIRVSNACAVQNGGCRHLCLPNVEQSRTCACPEYTSDGTAPICNEVGA